MKQQDIFNQLMTYLPLKTDLFSTILTVNSLVYGSGVVTAVTSAAHGLVTGNVVTIKGALEKLSITSITNDGNGIATATTATNHDLTIGFHENVTISGANQSEYNGTKTLLSVPTRKTFTFAITGTPITATGTMFLHELKYNGYNGTYNITKIDNTTFTYTPLRALGAYSGTPKASTAPRIYTGINIDKIIDTYTEQTDNKYSLFINLGGARASRDVKIKTDATYEYNGGSAYYNQNLIQTINLFVFAPTTTTVNAATIRDSFEDLRVYLINTLAAYSVNSPFISTTKNYLTYVDDNTEFYNGAFLIHRYSFETVFEINNEDIFKPLDSVMINSLQIKYLNDFDEIIKNDNKTF